MGIVNMGSDSFCGDGFKHTEAAIVKAESMIENGAEIIDVGGESARTNREVIEASEEIANLTSFVRLYQNAGLPALLSINTWRTEVARAVLETGGDLLNDISGLPDVDNAIVCAETGAALLIMHSVGMPKIPRRNVLYGDVMAAIEEHFCSRLALAESAGLHRNRIVLDPGIDFAKQRPDNLRIYRELDLLRKFERPILLPVSRKTVIDEVLGIPDPTKRDPGSIACVIAGYLRGAHIFRVHNVKAASQAIRICEAVFSEREEGTLT
jgi:dihydropteroate synthase